MKKFPYTAVLYTLMYAFLGGQANADCCNNNGGSAGCSNGFMVCQDGTVSNCPCAASTTNYYNGAEVDDFDDPYHNHHGHYSDEQHRAEAHRGGDAHRR